MKSWTAVWRKSPLKSVRQCDHFYLTEREPWHAWGSTVRFVIICLAQAMPTTALVWLAYLRR